MAQQIVGNSVVHLAGDSRALWLLGGLYEVRATGEETGGTTTIMEITLPAGAGPPPHLHEQDEVLYVLDGTVRHHIGDKSVEAGPGSVFFMPRGTLEWFEPISQARVLLVYTPGGVDRFFLEAGEPAARREIPPPMTSPPDLERLSAIGARYGLELRAPATR